MAEGAMEQPAATCCMKGHEEEKVGLTGDSCGEDDDEDGDLLVVLPPEEGEEDVILPPRVESCRETDEENKEESSALPPAMTEGGMEQPAGTCSMEGQEDEA